MTGRVLDFGVEAGIIAVLLLSPLPFGSVRPWAQASLEILVAVTAAMWVTRMLVAGRVAVRITPLLWPGLAMLALIGVQVVIPGRSVSPYATWESFPALRGLPHVPDRPQRVSRDAGAHRPARLDPRVLGCEPGVLGPRQSRHRARARALVREGVVPGPAGQHLRECEQPGALLRHPAVPRPRHGAAPLSARGRCPARAPWPRPCAARGSWRGSSSAAPPWCSASRSC